MKITFVLPYAGLSGGIRVVAIYAEMLQKLGHDVFVISQPRKQLNLRSRLKSLFQDKKSIFLSIDYSSYFDNLNVPHEVVEKNRPIKDTDVPDADIIIATWWETAGWVAKLSKSKGAKVYFIQHYEVHNYLPIERVRATYSLPFHKITVAKWLRDLMMEKYKDVNVSLVPNSVDTKQFSSPPREKQSVPTVGMMYSPIEWKGSDMSIKAFCLAKKRVSNLRLLAFGKPPYSSSLPLPLQDNYISQPPQNKIKDIYSQCDAWLFGSRTEGFGLPILEAMACRTPVIGTSVGAAPELLSNGAGILVKPEDPQDMSKAIVSICNLSSIEWQSISELAYTRATSYSWDDAAKLFEAELYTAITQNQNNYY